MHGVVSGVGLSGEAESLPILHDHATKRVGGGSGRVGGAKNLSQKKIHTCRVYELMSMCYAA